MILTENKNRLTIRWVTRNAETFRRIRERFNIPDYTTLNGWSPVEISDGDMEVFQETAKCGYFTILRQKWWKNGVHYSFKIRK